ncbi:pyroglutamyl-peptidase I [Coralloluteibacterium thermophilus]|uniref:Pyrrolidone-carboxylate peptidase n=1 Tax=Coralloluteibacterium thermophilum TaxID=2707049 RepID=A0ABV9NIP3_9GAMM
MSDPQTLLLTGFAPFGGETENPSWLAVRPLDGALIDGYRVVAVELPVVFGEALRALEAALDRHAPALVLCVGQAGGRAQVSLERVAINVDDARIPDNAGNLPVDTAVIEGGPAAYFSNLPIKAMREAARAAGVPCEISQTAGTFVCNHVFYGLMHALRERPGVRGGFVHIPYSPQQAAAHAGAPSLPVELATRALRAMLETALRTGEDVRIAAGATH